MATKIKELFIKCDCHTEILNIERDDDVGMYYFCIYEVDKNKMDWKQRFRYCWKVLTSGKAFNDQMVLSEQSMNELAEFNKQTNKLLD